MQVPCVRAVPSNSQSEQCKVILTVMNPPDFGHAIEMKLIFVSPNVFFVLEMMRADESNDPGCWDMAK